MASTIRLICPNLQCRKILTVPQTARGKTVRCRNCGIKINVPAAAPKPSPGSLPAPEAETEGQTAQ